MVTSGDDQGEPQRPDSLQHQLFCWKHHLSVQLVENFSLLKQFSGYLSRRGVRVSDSEAFCGRWSLKNPEILFNANDNTASGTIYSPIPLQTYNTVSTIWHLNISSSLIFLMNFSRMNIFTFLMYTFHFLCILLQLCLAYKGRLVNELGILFSYQENTYQEENIRISVLFDATDE